MSEAKDNDKLTGKCKEKFQQVQQAFENYKLRQK